LIEEVQAKKAKSD